jgi:hypothetical protein
MNSGFKLSRIHKTPTGISPVNTGMSKRPCTKTAVCDLVYAREDYAESNQ